MGPAVGLSVGGMGASGSWTQKQLGAAYIYSPSLLGVTGGFVDSSPSGGGGPVTLTAAGAARPLVDLGNSSQYLIDKSTGPWTGRTSIRTSPAASNLHSATGGVTGAQPWHIVAIVEYPTGTVSGAANLTNFAAFGTSGGANNVGLGASTGAFAIMGNGGSGTYPLPPVLDALPHVLEAKYDGSTLSASVDGKSYTIATSKTYAITDAGMGIQNWFPAYVMQDARIHALAMGSNVNFSAANVTAFLRSELARLATTGKGRMAAMFGDSTTAGTASGAEPLDASLRLQQSAPNIIFPANYGVSGERLDQIATRFNAFTGACTHVIIWGGRNAPSPQVTSSADAISAYASITQMVQRAHAIGAKVIVGTLDQWGASTTASYADDYRLALNALILANTAGADAIALVSEAMGAYNAANFCADTLHENVASERNIIAPALNTALLAL